MKVLLNKSTIDGILIKITSKWVQSDFPLKKFVNKRLQTKTSWIKITLKLTLNQFGFFLSNQIKF